MKVIVCGGRDYDDMETLYEVLDTLKITTIISGHARGADSMAEAYADERNLKLEIYPAEWDKYGKRAGFIRNQQMLDAGKPQMVVAFPGGNGTADMVRRARKEGVPVLSVS
jgi:hypothetical protein